MKVPAWIIPITDTVLVAVGEFELVHILPDKPEFFKVPQAPYYCQQVFTWQNRIIPIMNLAARFGYQTEAIGENYIIGIFAYRAEITELIEYGALFLNKAPRRIDVGDTQACLVPDHLQALTPYVWSCFQEFGTQKVIPILKLARLFAHQNKVSV